MRLAGLALVTVVWFSVPEWASIWHRGFWGMFALACMAAFGWRDESKE